MNPADFKMDIDDSNDIMNHYLVLIENVEQLKSFCNGNDSKHYPTIQQKLIDCCDQIDFIISLETNSSSFSALCQQKHQFTLLLDVTQKLIEGTIRPQSMHNRFDIQLPQSNNSHKRLQHQIPENETKKHKNDKSEGIITCSKEVPRLGGLNEIIGLHDIKKTLKSLVILPKTQPQLFYNLRICNSILIYGPPGTGKTQLTHALAAEANAAFHCISAGDVLSHYVGQTEKNIKTLFQHLKTSSEFTILFIDEIDALCRKRTANEQEHTRRIKTELMCQMSGIEGCTNMMIICATNCPWDLDSAILRRLQKRIYVPLPNHLERLEFFRFLTNNIHFESNHDWTFLAQKTDGYSGSDLFDLVQSAMTIPLNELEDTKIWKCCDDGFYEPILREQDFSNVICSELRDLPSNSVRARKVRLNDLLNAVETVKCTVMQADIKKYDCFHGI